MVGEARCVRTCFFVARKKKCGDLTDLVLLFVFFIEEMSGNSGGGLYPAPPREVTTSSLFLP